MIVLDNETKFIRFNDVGLLDFTLGTRGFSRVRREFSVLAEGRHIFGRRPKPRAAKPREKPAFRAGHYKDLTETGNRARKVAGIQGTLTCDKLRLRISNPIQTDSMFWID